MNYEIRYDLLQPWSTFVMKTELPPNILEKMLRITDEIIENEPVNTGTTIGAGQLKDQFFIDLKILEREKILEYFSGVCTHYVDLAFRQSKPHQNQPQKLHAWATTVWINSQKDNEYFPMHDHANCTLSATMYIKIPEFLPDRKSYAYLSEDGAVFFINNTSTDKSWAHSEFYVVPQVGDFFIFPAAQQHMVYPFRTADGKGERRSVSFNALHQVNGQEYQKSNK